MSAAGPWAGLGVLDTATMYAAPLIATLLADHGADVIKIGHPGATLGPALTFGYIAALELARREPSA